MPKIISDFMLHARELAVRGHGFVEPNPMVGCVLVNDQNKIVGTGYHEKCGEAHAEINALNAAGPLAKGATAYVTLEPCNHQGKTGPCAQALIDAGISKVVIGCADPNLEAAGGGTYLATNGVEVVYIDDELCKTILAPFLHRIRTGFPWVICKWAQTADGYIETPEGEDPWISCEGSQQLVHEERGRVDAIIVGIGTVVADNPSLTVRNAEAHRTPLRVIVDPTLRLPHNSTVLDGEVPTLIAHGKNVDKTAFTNYPVSFLELPEVDGSLDLRPLLTHLVNKYDATNVIVEGGKTLFEHIFNQQLANELWIFTSQRTIGNENLKNMTQLFNAWDCILENKQPCGNDLVCRYHVK
ncbi:MAG: bifunctional diaminohydroxyphosphoribosylaminopyrimidine deaminase/5-amino-6-(5-phosphoribosylamino)uracil reductase RibD [Phycisphaerae bacterium]|jgi:diaminohydroxyphosphoribosylaminopyrimidine deaminase / 5-amino-6-(5-phosphoribosylamino)uracil reductase|nr:bifunctional diaminohydroxyphosphoribosylaminopyrimidine deaminase/5-amino-6-(5-phosphoribosylamino)uracil reductase RibD [Phycisphaerae bacterium]